MTPTKALEIVRCRQPIQLYKYVMMKSNITMKTWRATKSKYGNKRVQLSIHVISVMKDRQGDKGVARWQKGPDIYQEGHFPRREQWHDKPGGKVIDGRYPAKKKFKSRQEERYSLRDGNPRQEFSWKVILREHLGGYVPLETMTKVFISHWPRQHCALALWEIKLLVKALLWTMLANMML